MPISKEKDLELVIVESPLEEKDFENAPYYSSSSNKASDNVLHQLLDDEKKHELLEVSLCSDLLFASSKEIDELDEKGLCVLHKILSYFLQMNIKNDSSNFNIGITLNMSYIDYRTYQNGIVLNLLQQYDQINPVSIKFLQWQILCREGEDLMRRWHMIHQQDTKREINDKVVKKFVGDIYKAMKNKHQLNDIIESIFSSGSLELLKYVKRYIEENRVELITTLLMNAVYWGVFAKSENVKHFQECFEYVLETADKKTLCETDDNLMTALHNADELNDEFMIKALLKKGASISQKDKEMRFPVQNVSYDVLQEFFDSLVTAVPTKFLKNEKSWRLIKSVCEEEYKLKGFIFMNFDTFLFLSFKYNDPVFDDFEFIDYMSETPKLCRLINHPVPATLLELHWSRFKKWIFLDQISVLYMILMIIGFIVKYAIPAHTADVEWWRETIDYISAAFSTLFLLGELIKNCRFFQLIVLIFVNMFRFILRQKICWEVRHLTKYQTITSVFMKVPLLALMIYYAVNHCDKDIQSCKHTVGISFILLSINVTLLIAHFSQTVAHYVIMFVYVSYTGFKFILSTFLVMFGFGLGLFMLINNFRYGLCKEAFGLGFANNETIETDALSSTDNKNKIDWGIVGLTLFRTFVMSTGELTVGCLDFYSIVSYIVFIFFIFIMHIVFFNLLNGLAIEDISLIKREAMFWYRKTQIMVLRKFNHSHSNKNKKSWIPKINISLYPNMIGKETFIGIDTNTSEVYSMKGLKPDERKFIGHLPLSVFANAKEILGERN